MPNRKCCQWRIILPCIVRKWRERIPFLMLSAQIMFIILVLQQTKYLSPSRSPLDMCTGMGFIPGAGLLKITTPKGSCLSQSQCSWSIDLGLETTIGTRRPSVGSIQGDLVIKILLSVPFLMLSFPYTCLSLCFPFLMLSSPYALGKFKLNGDWNSSSWARTFQGLSVLKSPILRRWSSMENSSRPGPFVLV